jgi:hypothetical protein
MAAVTDGCGYGSRGWQRSTRQVWEPRADWVVGIQFLAAALESIHLGADAVSLSPKCRLGI